jgi:hypothetical protein
MAEQLAAICDTVREAREFPDLFLGTGCAGAGRRDREAVEFAERAVIAELATGLAVSDSMMRAQAVEAETMRTRLPRLWVLFRAGEVSYQNARIVAEQAVMLPGDPGLLAGFDEALTPLAGTLTATKLRLRARTLRERMHAAWPHGPRRSTASSRTRSRARSSTWTAPAIGCRRICAAGWPPETADACSPAALADPRAATSTTPRTGNTAAPPRRTTWRTSAATTTGSSTRRNGPWSATPVAG